MGGQRPALIALAVAVVILPACGPRAPKSASEPKRHAGFITRADIERTGAVNGWDALKRSGSYLTLGERRSGEIRASGRGRSSFLLSGQLLLIVDEVAMNDLNILRDIPADNIEWMRILSGAEATPTYGTPASNGVLVVRTRIPPEL